MERKKMKPETKQKKKIGIARKLAKAAMIDKPKWKAAKLNFIFGIDYSKDNIENRIDGACARYLREKMKWNYLKH